MYRLPSVYRHWLVVMTLLVSCGASTGSEQPAPTIVRTAIPAAIENPTATLGSTTIPPTESATATIVKEVTINFAVFELVP